MARELKLDWKTVKELEKQYMREQLRRAPKPAPRVIGIDESAIRKDAKPILQENADCLKKDHVDAKTLLTGHCDERGTEEYNMALGERRANAAKKAFKGYGASKLETKSRGEYDLVVPNANE